MLTGHCGCGAVQFQISEPLAAAAWCHCTRCQRRSGNAYQGSARIVPGSFAFVAGEELVRKWTPGGGLAKCFCGECGSAVFAADPETGAVVVVRLGAIDGDPGIRPQAHQFVNYKAPWIDLPDDGLPRFPERVGATDPV
jgi:hypothetical protein